MHPRMWCERNRDRGRPASGMTVSWWLVPRAQNAPWRDSVLGTVRAEDGLEENNRCRVRDGAE